ncbi:hypothetical protein [Bradyrhizobium sp.]|uniref:hypothetical protein n=1 Tax=Bradyrhizobium sp. TaxID=376 RepID=UPI002DDD303A|nr:hypothetical protein [Bradyrhizobium sp.]HEV2153005.1 hypothetical protein [Bradyrhizobium sp.]
MTVFISREVKSAWGLPCNQNAEGELWAGKGYQKRLAGQFGKKVESEILAALTSGRGDRNGRFWVDLEERIVTMMVGEAADNKYKKVAF